MSKHINQESTVGRWYGVLSVQMLKTCGTNEPSHPLWPGEPLQRRANRQALLSGNFDLGRSSRTSVKLGLQEHENVEKCQGRLGASKAL